MDANDWVLLQVEIIAHQAPELKPIEKLNYKITTKSQTESRPPEPLLIANCSRLFQRPLDFYFNIFYKYTTIITFSIFSSYFL